MMKGFVKCLVAGLVLSLLLSGCGGTARVLDSGDSFVASGKSAMENSAEYSVDYDEEAPATEVAVNADRKLITTVSIDAETKDYDNLMAWISSAVSENGGYVEQSDMSSYNNETRSCNLTIRVPKDKLVSFVDALSEQSNVLRQSTNEEDVTLTYTDTESHRNALVTEQERLLELLEQAESLEDILSIEDRLTNVRYQLESMESQLRTFDNQIDYSTVSLHVTEVKDLTEPVPETWLERAGRGIKENVALIGTFFSELALFVVTHSPVLLLVGVLVVVLIIILRKVDKKSKANRALVQKQIEMQSKSDAKYNGFEPGVMHEVNVTKEKEE